MKSLIKLFAVAVALAATLFASDAPNPVVLSASTANGITTLVTVGRVQTINDNDPSTFTVFPFTTKTDSAGNVIVASLDTNKGFKFTLTPDQIVSLTASIQDAYAAIPVVHFDSVKAPMMLLVMDTNYTTGWGPNPKLTPGKVLPNITAKDLVAGYASKVRNVPASEKAKVYDEYGIKSHTAGQFEIDHLISLELGGSNDIENLWPQSYTATWNAHQKDKLENELHRLVVSGNMSLTDAQQEIASDWISLYKKVFPDEVINGEPKSVSRQPNADADDTSEVNSNVQLANK